MQSGFDEETQSFDIDKIVSGVTASKRGKIMDVKGVILELQKTIGKPVPLEELEKELEEKMTKVELDEAISNLETAGDLFRPKVGFVQLV